VRILLALAAVGLLLAAVAPTARPVPPPLTARAWVGIDANTGRVLIAQRAHERRPIASLTKIMTGLLVAEAGDLGRRVRVPTAATRVEPSLEGLRAGSSYRRRTLLYSSLLVSSNDSAEALGYDLGDGSLRRFYARMNARARTLGMDDTLYASASGLEDARNLSTAYDQAVLARAALRNSTFAHVVGTVRYVTRWAAPTIAKEWINHNRMLRTYPGTYGVKTGWTTRARACIAVAVRRGGRSVIVIVLGSKSLWTDTPELVERSFARL
jgi:serine-type D-Ala-D-Ala carboxypeptidase (penicillin-binding protein 5/6)